MNLLKTLFGGQPRTAPKTPADNGGTLFNMSFRFVALDVETANGDPSSICQIGLACVPSNGPILTHSTLIDPNSRFDAFNIDLHGIDPETVKGQPKFEEVFSGYQAFLSRHPLVQHSSFDKRAIEAACRACDLPAPNLTWHDSVTMARRAWPEFKGNGGHGLANLKQELSLDFEHHDAEEDARAAAQVVLLAEERTGLSFVELSAPAKKAFRAPKI